MDELIVVLIIPLIVGLVLALVSFAVFSFAGKNFVASALMVVLFLNWLVLPPSLLSPFIGMFVFDFGNTFENWVAFLGIACFPITIIVAIVVARYLRKRGKERRALLAACLPLLHIECLLLLAYAQS